MVFGGMHAYHGVHSLKWYNLKENAWREGDIGEKKITALEWAPDNGTEEKDHLWAGTKDGCLLLLSLSLSSSIATGTPDLEIIDQRLGWHANPIQHLIRVGEKMLSVDEGGKCVVFSSNNAGEIETSVKPLGSFRHPVPSAAPGISWVSVINNMVWVAYGNGLRVYNFEEPAARPITLSSSSSGDKIGPIVCGTIIPSRPGRVYTGHEGGVVSTWSYPTSAGSQDYNFLGTTKIGVSDVLCLVGVNDRLWAGGRTGIISIYTLPPLSPDGHKKMHVVHAVKELDTEEECKNELWKVTNEFVAHLDVPIVSLVVDPFSIEKMGRLAVISAGRDEQLKFWDGLLGTEWIGESLERSRNLGAEGFLLRVEIIDTRE